VTGSRGRALVAAGPGRLALADRDVPDLRSEEILVYPELVGLCGTDLEIIDGAIDPAYVRYPLVIGHEWTGRLAGGHPAISPGTRVVVEGIIGCWRCDRCRGGETGLCETAYQEIGFTRDGAAGTAVAVPASQVHSLSGAVAAEDAVLTEPAAVVYRALSRSSVAPGCRALVIGDGTVALLAVYLLGLWSPAEVVMLGQRPQQAALAAAAGAGRFVTGPAAAGGGFDLVVEAAGSVSAAEIALGQAARRGGEVVLLGLPPHGERAALGVDDLVNNDLTVTCSFGYNPAAWRRVVTLLGAGRIRPGFLITHRYPLGEWQQALAVLRGDPATADGGPRGKVLLEVTPAEAGAR
jgi:L-iditol 2-dehydrogenase